MDHWAGVRVLVTGAGGFIGSHLVERLLAEGALVRAFVRYTSRGHAGFLDSSPADARDRLEIVHGDLRDQDAVAGAARGVSHIFHLGALVGIPYSCIHPRETIETNVLGTLNVLTAAHQAGVQRVVHTSSSEVYGTARYVPIDEDHPLQGQSPYSASKIAGDKIAESFHATFDLPLTTLRPFNTYGPRQSARAVIPTIITQLLSGKRVVTLGNLEPTRDFTFVADMVEGFVRVAQCDAAIGRVLNLGSGFEISIRDLAMKIAEALGSEIELTSDPTRVRPEGSEVERLLADYHLARELMGWTPVISFEEGLRLTAQWIQENLDYYRRGEYQV